MGIDLLLCYPPDMHVRFCGSIPELIGYLRKNDFKVGYSTNVFYDIPRFHPRYIGVSIPFSFLADNAKKLIRQIKQKHPYIPVVAGGVHCMVCPDDMADVADIVCVGEGELFLEALLEHDEIIEPVFVDLNTVPLPIWKSVEREAESRLVTGEHALVYSGSRGCPFDCVFCSNHLISHKKVRYRGVPLVLHDLQLLKEEYGCNVFDFRDETFTMDKKRVFKLCDGLKNLGVRWWAQTRANLVDKDLLKMMKQAGCIGLSFGVESGNQEILEKIHKNILLDDARHAVQLCKQTGLLSYCGFILGHYWDTVDTVFDTIHFALELNPDYVGFSVMCPYPGSYAYDYAKQNGGLLTEDFSKYQGGYVVFQPPALVNIDLLQLQKHAYTMFYAKDFEQLKKYGVQMFNKKGWKPKADYLLSLITRFLPYLLLKKEVSYESGS